MKIKSTVTSGESIVDDITIKYTINSDGRISGYMTDKDNSSVGAINIPNKGELGIYFNEKGEIPFIQKKKVIEVILSDLEELIND